VSPVGLRLIFSSAGFMVKRRMSLLDESFKRLSLREQVELLLPSWQSWYPSLFDAAADLGLIRARVCAPSSLMLSNRHASVQLEAEQAFKEQWSVEDEPELPPVTLRLQNKTYRIGQPKKKSKKRRR
jgi:hypothetical protein